MGYRDLDEVSYSLIKEGEPFQQVLGEFLLDWIDKETYISVKTSGSTGTPKNIRLEKQHMVNSALATGAFFDLYPGNIALLCLPGDYIAGKMMLVRAMILGLELDWIAPSLTPLRSLETCYHFCAMVPVQLENSLDQIDHIKTLIVGGGPTSENLKAQVQDKKTDIFETYGMTETISHIAIRKVNHGATDYFETLPNVKVHTDERNCLVINAPDLSEAPIGTNDMVALLSERRFKWLGRYDNVINSGGIKLIPEQIEGKLATVVKQRFFVAGIPDKPLGERLALFVETPHKDDGLQERIGALKNLEKFEVPKDIVYMERFVETENGKISRPKTLQKFFNGKDNSPNH
ncbi:MAG: AMP-binding protein [Maribacter sp.]|uniref:AMP-binding protein n=1 Tax=Maribacter sp. TaxID=1897614 RepID=UPI003C756A18